MVKLSVVTPPDITDAGLKLIFTTGGGGAGVTVNVVEAFTGVEFDVTVI